MNNQTQYEEWHNSLLKETDFNTKTKKDYLQFRFEYKYFTFDFTPLNWGIGFDLGYIFMFSIGIWIGPFYFEIHSDE